MNSVDQTMPTNSLRREILLLTMATIIFAYVVAVAFVGARTAIELGNVLVFSLSAGIIVAYSPIVKDALSYEYVDGGSILSIGIYLGWSATFIARGFSIVWRLLGQPVEWLDSAIWGGHIALSCASAVAHMVAPGAVAGKVPTQQWLRIGALVALSVLAFSVLLVLGDIGFLEFAR